MDEFNVLDHETKQLDELGEQFLHALALKDKGHIDKAKETLESILRTEPRLAEPRMELARIFLDTDRVEDAEEHASQALEDLNNHGQWVENVSENTLTALAHALVAEALRRRADEDDIIFGDPDVFKDILKRSQSHFKKAAELDPRDEYSSYHAFFMGPEKKKTN